MAFQLECCGLSISNNTTKKNLDVPSISSNGLPLGYALWLHDLIVLTETFFKKLVFYFECREIIFSKSSKLFFYNLAWLMAFELQCP
jgi:hypothetical protein